MKKYEAEPPTKNEFLSDLHRIDSSEMEAKVCFGETMCTLLELTCPYYRLWKQRRMPSTMR